MRRRERITVAIAVQILREAMVAGAQIDPGDAGVRLALRVLLPHCPPSAGI